MSIFSDLLGKHIAAKAIKSNEMAQFCGIERSFMYKIIKGTRHVANKDTVLLMAEYLRLTPSERNDFIESYKISVDGLENYYRRKSILELFENFKNTLKFIPPRPLRLYPVSRILRVYLP